MLDTSTNGSEWRPAGHSDAPTDRDYLTILTSERPIGKKFFGSLEGFEKERLNDSGSYRAKTIRVKNNAKLAKRLKSLKKNQAIINGFVPGTENGKPFYIETEKNLREITATPPDKPRPKAIYASTEKGDVLIVGRFKDVFVNSSFLFFDFDYSSQMPEGLRWQSPAQALAMLGQLDPELRGCNHLIIPSSSGRVLVEGSNKRPFSGESFHLYIQIENEDADLINDYYFRLIATAVAKGLAFHKTFQRKDGTKCQRLCTFFDRSVATPGRLIFAGPPTVESPLTLEDSEPVIQMGRKLRLSALPCPDQSRLSEYGLGIEKNGRSYVFSESTLDVDMTIEAQHGREVTVLEYLCGDEVHVRCQTAFRESVSYAAFLGRNRQGIPFVHDAATQTNHYLNPESLFEAIKARFQEHRLDSLLNKECMTMCAVLVEMDSGWLPIIKQAAKDEKIGMTDIVREIGKAQKIWKNKWREHRDRLVTTYSAAQDKETLIWDQSRASEIVRQVRLKLAEKPNNSRVFNYCGKPSEIIIPPLTDRDLGNRVLSTPLIRPLTLTSIAEKVEAIYSIFKETADGTLCPIDTPRELRDRGVNNYPDELPVLNGVIRHPVVTANGGIISGPGYDAGTGLYIADDIELTDLAHKVSLKSAKRSFKKLVKHLLADFPFGSPEDEAAAIAIALTILCRQALDIAPAFSISSPDYGTGKTTLARTVCAGVLGSIVATRSMPADDTEFQKVMVAELLSGAEVIFLDNANPKREQKSDVLAQVLTSPLFEGRRLGTNEMVSAQTKVTFIGTGKNFRVTADLASRFIPIRLEPGTGTANTKDFRHPEPEQWAIDNRPQILIHLMRIIKGYVDAGLPSADLPASRFPAWDRLVRQAIFWVSGADVCARMSEQIAEDPDNEQYFGLLSAMRNIFGNCRFPLSEVAGAVRRSEYDKSSQALLDAVEAVSPACVNRRSGRPKLNSQLLSVSLRAFVDQEIYGLILKKTDDPNRSSQSSKRVKHWCVVSAEDGYKIGPAYEDHDDDDSDGLD